MSGAFYLFLFHGRMTADEEMKDWGFDGPLIGPVNLSWTYGNLKVHTPDWQDFEWLPIEGHCVRFDGKYFGDYEVWAPDDPHLARTELTRLDYAAFVRLLNAPAAPATPVTATAGLPDR